MTALSYVKFLLLAVLAVGAAIGQGYIVFLFQVHDGSFLSLVGLKCVAVPVGIEAIVAVVTLRNIDQLRATAIANPHSQIGAALREGSKPAPEPPSARDAWDGHWEDEAQAADKMARKP